MRKYEKTVTAIRRRREIVVFEKGTPLLMTSLIPKRGIVTEFSKSSSARLRRTVNNTWCNWRAMWTMTYRTTPEDGAQVKGDMRKLWERLRRKGYLEANAIIWWIEFQARGAAHIHCLTTGWLDKQWLATNWADITDGDARVCTRVEALRNPDAAGAYAAKYASKKEQKIAPDWFGPVGRWWGYVGTRPKIEQMPDWYASAHADTRAQARSGARAPEGPRGARLVPRVAAPTTPEAVRLAIQVVRTAGDRRQRCYATDYAVIFYGSELEINDIWEMLRCPSTVLA